MSARGDEALREAARLARGDPASVPALFALAARQGDPAGWPEWLRAEVRQHAWARAHAALLAATPEAHRRQRRWLTEHGSSPFSGVNARRARWAALAKWHAVLTGDSRYAPDHERMVVREVSVVLGGHRRWAPVLWLDETREWVFLANGAEAFPPAPNGSVTRFLEPPKPR